ncbi:hypothetical protein F442_07354 [Phytophthora nicotianae P10297]|uniref:Uncharacterized protein n=4 Tax=Phytophthora nicotianae TaxID=4792 RepID=W2ZGA9_PHYNI|nr:hypothetical protein L915_07154 [Phytophthora nicotianae]ETP46397.1 hypothetical protein F442_07354 [Phytophthora nicotianae P10297]
MQSIGALKHQSGDTRLSLGCIVALVQQQHAQKLMDTLDAGYPVAKFGSTLPKPASFLTRIGDGAHVVQAGVPTPAA